MFTRQDLDKAVSKACEALEKENARLLSLMAKIDNWKLDHDRIYGVAREIFLEHVKPISHLWDEFNQPPGIGMICEKLLELSKNNPNQTRDQAIILTLTEAMSKIANCGGAAGVFCQQIARDAIARADAVGKGEK